MSGQGAPSTATDGLAPVVVQAKDLPVFCPNKSMPRWSSHPRVFLEIAPTGEVMCPYCGTRYVLEGGPLPGAH